SSGPPITAVFPVADRATAAPNSAFPVSSLAVSFLPCWVQVDPDRVNAHAAPLNMLSPGPPINAVLPSEESATPAPNSGPLISPLPVSLAPCRLHVDPTRVNTHAAPTSELSPGPPISAVLPSEESAALTPNLPPPVSPAPVSFACSLQVVPERVNTHAAPTLVLSSRAPISAVPLVLSVAASATLVPNRPLPTSPVPVSLACCVQVEPVRVNTPAARTSELSNGPPMMAVSLLGVPTATLKPNFAPPISLPPVSFACSVQTDPERVNTHAAPASLLSPGPPTRAVLPSG